MNQNKLSQYALYLWLLAWPWQAKLILVAASSNYLEISFFLSLLLLLIPILIWGRRIFTEDYFRFKKELDKPLWWSGLILLEFITFLSIFWADDKILALSRYLILVLGILLFYLVKRSDFVKVTQVGKIFLIGLIPPAILGIWQFFSQSASANKYLGLAYHSAVILGDSIIETSAGRYLRAYGSFDHPNILGGLMAVALILALYLSLQKIISRNNRLFYFISFAIFYTALLLSFSRSGIIAFFVSAPFLIFHFWRQGVFQKKMIALFLFLLVFISAIIIIPYSDLFLGRVDASSRLEKKSITERETYLGQATRLIIKKPLQGVGAGNYVLAEQKSDDSSHETWYYQPVHNYWLLVWAELGIFGLFGALIFWLAIIKISAKKYLWPLGLALFIISLLDHWLWTQPLGLITFFLLAALMFNEDF
ncbi:MAG: O-antigen ligase family protein [Candidatus Falkowbacteria bacterium]